MTVVVPLGAVGRVLWVFQGPCGCVRSVFRGPAASIRPIVTRRPRYRRLTGGRRMRLLLERDRRHGTEAECRAPQGVPTSNEVEDRPSLGRPPQRDAVRQFALERRE